MADCFFVAVTAVTNDMSGSHGPWLMAHGEGEIGRELQRHLH